MLLLPVVVSLHQNKLELRSSTCVFLGYGKINKGFLCLELSTSKVYISRHVQFDELVFPFSGLISSFTGSQAPQSTTLIATLFLLPTIRMLDLPAKLQSNLLSLAQRIVT